MGLAAALLYLSSRNTKDDGITQLATAAGVTEVTIRNRMKEENVNSFLSQDGLVIPVRKYMWMQYGKMYLIS